MKYSDLPAKMKAQVDAAMGRDAERKPKRSRAVARGAGTWHCRDCPETFDSDAAMLRHVQAAHHHRYDLITGLAGPTPVASRPVDHSTEGE